MSLVEMLCVLGVASILLVGTLPSWRDILRSQALKAASAMWMACLSQARAHALRSGAPVAVLPVVPADWNQGWRLVRDANANQALDAGEEILHAYGPIAGSVNISVDFGSDKPPQFLPSGRPRQAGTVLLTAGPQRRKLVVNLLGRTRACDPDAAGADC
jgi:type IV fimbrial biogenesis protein FimT